jgi:orotidine-5'-phosphate decarboxylase
LESRTRAGLQLFSTCGPRAVETIGDLGLDVFLDLKLHDIPNTVASAARELGRLGARYLTVHAAGGEAMLRAAVEGLTEGAQQAGLPTPTVLAVTVLTSITDATPETLTERLTTAVAAGCPGVVCAAPDLATIKATAPDIFAVTPGIRPAGGDTHDQARVATPTDAITAGADLLVIGRPITNASDPAQAAAHIAAEISTALS